MSNKKTALIAFTVFLLLALSYLIVWRVMAWNRYGWLGMVIEPFEAGKEIHVSIGAIQSGEPGTITEMMDRGPAREAGLNLGDEVVSIDDIPFADRERMQQMASRLRPGSEMSFRINRDKQELLIPVRVDSPLADFRMSSYWGISIVSSVIYLLIGFFVYWKKPDDRRAYVFFAMCAVATVYFIKGIFLPPDTFDSLNIVGTGLSTVRTVAHSVSIPLLALMMTLFCHFAALFPREIPELQRHPKLFRRFYGGILLVVLYIPVPAFWGERFPLLALGVIPGFFFLIVLFLLSSISTCFLLIRSYRRAGPEEKKQIRWPLWGISLAVGGQMLIPPAVILVLLVFPWLGATGTGILTFKSVWKILYLMIPLSFGFAILKYRFMDIDLIIRKTILYTVYTGMILFFYVILVGGLGSLMLKWVQVKSEWIMVFSTLAIAVVFVPLRKRAQDFVDRRFFRKKVDFAGVLAEVNRKILTAPNVESLSQAVAESIQPALQCRNAAVFVKKDHSYVCAGKAGIDSDLSTLKFGSHCDFLQQMDSTIAPASGQPEIVTALDTLQSDLLVPVKINKRLVAFMSLGSKLSEQTPDANETRFLLAVSDQMAVGIHNLQFRAQEIEFDRAKEIQTGLLPRQLPQIEGFQISGVWQPAKAVGGDYYDVLKLSETRVGICIADVVGKGMPAAILMSNLQATVRGFAPDSASPQQLCNRINQLLCQNTSAGKYITFFYSELDSYKKTLTYCNAGHNPPILMKNGNTILRLESGGPVLGVFPDAFYEQGSVELHSGDRLLFFTDGITEATNASDEEFSDDGLIACLSANRHLTAEDLQALVLKTVTSFNQGLFQDDATLIALAVE